jgi:hypothetical protein
VGRADEEEGDRVTGDLEVLVQRIAGVDEELAGRRRALPVRDLATVELGVPPRTGTGGGREVDLVPIGAGRLGGRQDGQATAGGEVEPPRAQPWRRPRRGLLPASPSSRASPRSKTASRRRSRPRALAELSSPNVGDQPSGCPRDSCDRRLHGGRSFREPGERGLGHGRWARRRVISPPGTGSVGWGRRCARAGRGLAVHPEG